MSSPMSPSVGYNFNFNRTDYGPTWSKVQRNQAATERWLGSLGAETQRWLGALQGRNIQAAGAYYEPWQREAAQDLIGWGQGVLGQFSPSSTGYGPGDMGGFGTPGSFAAMYPEVGGPPMDFGTPNYEDMAMTDAKMNRIANRAVAGFDPKIEAGLRYAREHLPMNTTGALASPRAEEKARYAALAARSGLIGQLETVAPDKNRQAYETMLAYKQAESADELARRALTINREGNLMSLYGNIYNRQQQWAPQIASVMAGLVQPLPFSYAGVGGEAGKNLLFEAGLHPNQLGLAGSGYQPSDEAYNIFEYPDVNPGYWGIRPTFSN